jgi:predicted permease
MDDTPTPTASKTEHREAHLNYLRGSCFALLFGAIGFASPILVMVGYTVLSWRIHETREFDRKYDLRILQRELIFPAVGTAWVFAATGWATFATRSKYRFAKTLAIIVSISVPLWYLLAVIGMSPPRDKGIDHPLIYPSEIILCAIPPSLIALVLSAKSCLGKDTIRSNLDGNG